MEVKMKCDRYEQMIKEMDKRIWKLENPPKFMTNEKLPDDWRIVGSPKLIEEHFEYEPEYRWQYYMVNDKTGILMTEFESTLIAAVESCEKSKKIDP
jgi:hypothetical protein